MFAFSMLGVIHTRCSEATGDELFLVIEHEYIYVIELAWGSKVFLSWRLAKPLASFINVLQT